MSRLFFVVAAVEGSMYKKRVGMWFGGKMSPFGSILSVVLAKVPSLNIDILLNLHKEKPYKIWLMEKCFKF